MPFYSRNFTMKKTASALLATAFLANETSALTYKVEETGTQIDFTGSARLQWHSTENIFQ